MKDVQYQNVTSFINGTGHNVSSDGNQGNDVRTQAMSYLIYKIGRTYKFRFAINNCKIMSDEILNQN